MASPTQWTWVWVNSRSCWWTGRPGVLRFMGSQSVGHDWATELNWTELNWMSRLKYLGKKWCLNSTGSGWWERGKAHAPVHWRQLPDTLCCTCGDGSKVSCCFLRQTVSISTALPHRFFLVLALSLKQLWEVGEGSLLLGNTPPDSLGFDVVPDHPFGPSTLFSILKS